MSIKELSVAKLLVGESTHWSTAARPLSEKWFPWPLTSALIKLLALDYEDLTGNTYQGSLGGEDNLKQLQGTEAYKLNPESVIKDSIENIKIDGVIKPGANGTYTIGNELYEYVNGVVRRLK